jgi:hypothetical protein
LRAALAGHRTKGPFHQNLRAEVLDVEIESLSARAGEVQIGIQFHRLKFPFGELDFDFDFAPFLSIADQRLALHARATNASYGVRMQCAISISR